MANVLSTRLVFLAVGMTAVALTLFLGHSPPLLREAAAAPGAAGEAAPPFADVTEAVGLKGNNGGVAAWGDFDNDGWVDLCIGGEVWRNERGKRFTRVARLGGPGVWGDYDNDGFLDLFCWESGKLYRNLNGRAFEEVKF